MRQVNLKVLEKLPELCFAIDAGTGAVIAIKKGERGYWTTKDMVAADVDFFNEKLGVTPAQREAMIAGSLFGFDVPGADPAVYEGRV